MAGGLQATTAGDRGPIQPVVRRRLGRRLPTACSLGPREWRARRTTVVAWRPPLPVEFIQSVQAAVAQSRDSRRPRRTLAAIVVAVAMVFAVLPVSGTDAAINSANITPSYQALPNDTYRTNWSLYVVQNATHTWTYAFGDGQSRIYTNKPSGSHSEVPSHTFSWWCGTGQRTFTQKLTFSGSSASATASTRLNKTNPAC